MSAPTKGPYRVSPSTRYRGDIGIAWDIYVGDGPVVWDRNDYDREEGMRGVWDLPDGYLRIATTSDMGPEAKANAHLLAASWEMREALEGVDKCVPTNWLDPLLTGPKAVVAKSDCREIEALLRGIQDRIRQHVAAALAKAQGARHEG